MIRRLRWYARMLREEYMLAMVCDRRGHAWQPSGALPLATVDHCVRCNSFRITPDDRERVQIVFTQYQLEGALIRIKQEEEEL